MHNSYCSTQYLHNCYCCIPIAIAVSSGDQIKA
nr:MAG TPA: Protein of unknown function (DUF1221) [Caudoviricetes sp.]